MNSYNAKEKSNLPKKVDKAKCKPFVEWYKKEITADCFEIRKGNDNKYYAHHKDWKKTVWIGPYDSEDEVKKVINSYVSVTKKPFGERKELKNVHSIIVNDKDFFV